MTATRLSLYNGALRLCGERRLASLTEERKPRRLLDDVWDNDGVRTCLEQAQWKFAMRTVQLDYDTAVEPDFGYRYAFAKPADWVKTAAVCHDEHFNVPLSEFEDEAGYWYADIDIIYVRYVSNDTSYGMDLSRWPATFQRYVEAYLASEIILDLSSDKGKQEAILAPRSGILSRRLSDAKATDAMNGPARFPAQGGWSSSRQGRARGDRGRRGQLIG